MCAHITRNAQRLPVWQNFHDRSILIRSWRLKFWSSLGMNTMSRRQNQRRLSFILKLFTLGYLDSLNLANISCKQTQHFRKNLNAFFSSSIVDCSWINCHLVGLNILCSQLFSKLIDHYSINCVCVFIFMWFQHQIIRTLNLTSGCYVDHRVPCNALK